MIRRILLALLLVGLTLSSAAAEVKSPGNPTALSGTITGTYTLGGTPTLSTTLQAGASGFIALGLMPYQNGSINSNAVTLNAAGSGYLLTNTIIGACSGCTFTAAPVTAISDIQAVSATVAGGGSGGTNGACTVTDASATTNITYTTPAQFTGTVVGNALTGPLTVAVAGDYSTTQSVGSPTNPIAVSGCGLTGATLTVTYGVLKVVMNNPGVATAVPAKTAVLTQASTSGSGTGAAFNIAFIPQSAGTVNDGTLANGGNTYNGAETPQATLIGNENTFFGDRAGGNFIGGSSFNAAFGHNACGIGGSTGVGSQSSCFGTDAGRNLTAPVGVTAIGEGAIKNGSASAMTNLTAVGVGAMQNYNSGTNSQSAALGDFACSGAVNSSYTNTTCLGARTGGALSSGANRTLIGHGVGNATLTSASGVLLIGSGAVTVDGNTSNALNIENIISATGTGTPSTSVTTIAGNTTLTGATTTLSGVTTGTNADVLCVDASKVIRLQAAASCTISSMRFKNSIEPVMASRSLDNVLALRPATFYYNDGAQNADKNAARLHVGLIAEDVASVDPRLTIYEPDMKTPKSWHLEGMIAELVGAVQAQQRQIDRIDRRRMYYR